MDYDSKLKNDLKARIKLGNFLEKIDLLAGNAAYLNKLCKHIYNPETGNPLDLQPIFKELIIALTEFKKNMGRVDAVEKSSHDR